MPRGLAITLSLAPSMGHSAAVASREQRPAALRSPLGIRCWVESWFEGGQLRREAVASSGNLCFWKAAKRREGSSSTKQCVKNPGTYKTQNKEDIPDPDCVRHGCKDSLPDYIGFFPNLCSFHLESEVGSQPRYPLSPSFVPAWSAYTAGRKQILSICSPDTTQAQAAADSLVFCKGPPFPYLSLLFLLHHCVKLPNEMPSRHPEFLLDSLSISLPQHFLHNHLANNCLLAGKVFSASHFLQPLRLALISISKHTLEQQKKEVRLRERFLMICHGSQDV